MITLLNNFRWIFCKNLVYCHIQKQEKRFGRFFLLRFQGVAYPERFSLGCLLFIVFDFVCRKNDDFLFGE